MRSSWEGGGGGGFEALNNPSRRTDRPTDIGSIVLEERAKLIQAGQELKADFRLPTGLIVLSLSPNDNSSLA